MKKWTWIICALLAASACMAQSYWPEQAVKDMRGRTKTLGEFASERGTTLFVFWKTCCPNNISMIDELVEAWTNYVDAENPIEVVLVSVDDQRTASRVRPIVGTNGWEWEVIMDTNGDLARTYNIIVPPQWIAFDRFGREIFRSKITNGTLDAEIYFQKLVDRIHVNP